MARKPHIDWIRGLAVLLMIFWHVLDAWTVLDRRDTRAFLFVTFLGGWAAPMFVFLAGVSVPLAGAARMSRGATRQAAGWSIEKRGWEILLLAHVFRFQSFLFNPSAEWNSLLMPDILNVIGLAVVATAFCWERATSNRGEAAWLLIPAVRVRRGDHAVGAGLDVAVPAPAPHRGLHPPGRQLRRLQLFPWVAYVFLGAYLGVLIARQADERALYRLDGAYRARSHCDRRRARFVRAVAAFEKCVVWRVLMFAFRAGAMARCLPPPGRSCAGVEPARGNFMMLFGRRSLFVYWVHVELAYGVFSYPLHHAFTLPWALVACALFTWGMVGFANSGTGARPARR